MRLDLCEKNRTKIVPYKLTLSKKEAITYKFHFLINVCGDLQKKNTRKKHIIRNGFLEIQN